MIWTSETSERFGSLVLDGQNLFPPAPAMAPAPAEFAALLPVPTINYRFSRYESIERDGFYTVWQILIHVGLLIFRGPLPFPRRLAMVALLPAQRRLSEQNRIHLTENAAGEKQPNLGENCVNFFQEI